MAPLDPCIWAVREGDERFQSLAEFLDYVAKNPNEVIISSTAVGSDDHMGIALLKRIFLILRSEKFTQMEILKRSKKY
ncbi:MAG: hypothetical protein CM15mP117_17480 [Alphaproteobacteria bacterium]|nr:MAG: hypothetical protein CM15mP117_17480 [Alphaproteobacteria bacterium]